MTCDINDMWAECRHLRSALNHLLSGATQTVTFCHRLSRAVMLSIELLEPGRPGVGVGGLSQLERDTRTSERRWQYILDEYKQMTIKT